MKIFPSPHLDPAGKVTDIYQPVNRLRTFVFHQRAGLRESIEGICLQALKTISEAPSKRIQNREIPLRIGDYANTAGRQMVVLGLPYDLYDSVFHVFYDLLSQHPSFIEVSSCSVSDFYPTPFVRYSRGRLIWYVDHFTNPEDVRPPSGLKFEIRSCEQPPKRTVNPYTRPELPSFTAPERHDEKLWLQNRQSILRFIFDLKGPCGYRRLSKIARQCFGITVHEEPSSDFKQFGLIRISDNTDGKPPYVRILIRSGMDDRLKYVVLAHEISHYVIHFPVLITSKSVEQYSYEVPEFERYYFLRLNSGNHPLSKQIEDEADELASYFLIPPWIRPLKKLTGVILEGGRSPSPEEMIWRFLQPLFPEDKFANVGWNDLKEIKERARRDSQRVSSDNPGSVTSLFHRILRACLRVEGKHPDKPAGERAIQFCQAILADLNRMSKMDNHTARKKIGARIEKELRSVNEDVPHLEINGETSFCRESVAPLDWDGTSPYPRIPLRPAIYNRSGYKKGEWQRLGGSPVGTLQEWRNWKRDHGLLLYRFESWQRKKLSGR